MFWEAIVIGHHSPYHLWEKDTEEDKLHFRAIVNEENAIHLQEVQYNQMQASIEGMPITYLVEDNAPAHQRACEVDFAEQKLNGILTLDWPLKSPDLNAIKEVWKEEKNEMATYQFTGVGQKTVEEAKATLARVWKETSQLYIDLHCHAFHRRQHATILQLILLHSHFTTFVQQAGSL
ncbi:hypothetical protein L873DRAFT_1788675 [Choiromyces venosus 120613-1]|uniref:Tc1-like transposase DDE domain-containing protein n=1 Tax=Choiromyces venosus 120613-1 TaxID=1336337 RepID=A0A3N4K587_9PEZI|nr:hypothetical protein L873DRAFT_1788675 [Choiromyces venosus 120613-1]